MSLLLRDGPRRVLIWRRDRIRQLGYLDRGPESLVWPLLRPGTQPMDFSSQGEAEAFLSGLLTDPWNRQRVRQGLALEQHLQVSRWGDSELVAQLASWLVTGGFKALAWTEEPEHGASGEGAGSGEASASIQSTPLEDEEAAQAAKPPVDPSEEHFIEIELVDDQGEPVSGELYFVELPDGSSKSGRTNAQGYARIDGVDPGTAKVSFPDRDKAAYDSQ